jgi:ribosomal protein S20
MPAPSGPRADFLQLRDSYKAIGTSVQSGDLEAAKEALDALRDALQELPGRRGDKSQAGRGARLADALQALDTALQSGDADAAKQAFETLTKDMQSLRARGHHHHRAKEQDAGETPSGGTTAGTTATGTGKIDISV